MSADSGEVWLRRGADRRAAPVGARAPGPRPDVPDHPALPRDDRAARTSLRRCPSSRGAQLARTPSAARGAPSPGAARVRRDAGLRRPAGRPPCRSAAEARRAGPGSHARPAPDPARRAGRRHQPDAHRPDRRDDPGAQPTGHDVPDRRAQHADGARPLRPGRSFSRAASRISRRASPRPRSRQTTTACSTPTSESDYVGPTQAGGALSAASYPA